MPLAPLRLCLALWAVLLLATAAPAFAADATVGRAVYDAALGAISVPYEGATPPRPVAGVMGPRHHYVDLQGARLRHPDVQRPAPGAALSRLELADRPGRAAVRVAFEGPRPMRPVIRVDHPGRRVLIFPLGRAAAAAPRTAAARPTPKPQPSALKPLPVVTPASPPPSAIRTRFARPYFDAARQAVVLPFVGAAPGYRLLSAPAGALEVQVPDAALQTPGAVARDVAGHPVLTRFEAADDPQLGALTLRLSCERPGEALVAIDAAKRQLLVFPQAAPMRAEAAGPLKAVLGRVAFDRRLAALVVPYYGQAPAYAVEPVGSRHVAVDFLAAAIEPAGVQFEAVTEMPLLSFWMAAPSQAPRVVRLSVVMPYGGHLKVLDDAPNRRLLLMPQLGPEPSPAP